MDTQVPTWHSKGGSLQLKAGEPVASREMKTAGKPYALKLTLGSDNIQADGEDLAFVRVQVVDKEGNLCPTATNQVTFKVRGAGQYHSSANGDATCIVPFQSSKCPILGTLHRHSGGRQKAWYSHPHRLLTKG